jgi:tRNA threonylcarbamoyladenosine dehydratase
VAKTTVAAGADDRGAGGEVSCERPDDADMRLNCARGYGTATHVTATFGVVAAGAMLDFLATQSFE